MQGRVRGRQFPVKLSLVRGVYFAKRGRRTLASRRRTWPFLDQNFLCQEIAAQLHTISPHRAFTHPLLNQKSCNFIAYQQHGHNKV